DGKVSLSDATDQKARFAAAGWDVFACDGHDPEDIDRALRAAAASDRPAFVACTTHIALGSSAQDTPKGHGALTDAKLIADTKAAYGWDHPAFHIPDDLRALWRATGERGRVARAEWEARLAALPEKRRAEFRRIFSGEAPKRLATAIRAVKARAVAERPKLATRAASEAVLKAVNPVMPETIGGSAGLTGSNNTKTPDLGVFSPEDRKGRYVYFGIREHGMAAAMNGMALHGGIRPYGGTFLIFSDYMRPAIRLAALQHLPSIFVYTHDSVYLGEDGPTHQPVEHLALCRATPNTLTIRPADATETAEAWEIALSPTRTPTVLALSRQNLPTVRQDAGARNMVARGAYVLAEAEGGKPRALLMATGSEVAVALAARDLLQAEGIPTRVVSFPCWELFEEQDETWRRKVLPKGPVRVAVEAGIRFGWDRWLYGERGTREKSGFVGMHGFGASAPAETLYREFGITAQAVADKAKSLL
ncbi:MAG TPA: transketolase C-terminal domain-containing protein, partial [Paracoccaceae bacterium]|nr:transketolase C-terminal domain-containing protein [Paracoccaceae bacterium]